LITEDPVPVPHELIFSKDAEIFPTNRLAQPSPATQPALEQGTLLGAPLPEARSPGRSTFEVCGMRLHISKKAQVELKGGTLYSAWTKST